MTTRWTTNRCMNGHDVSDPANVYVHRGTRRCKACRKAYQRRALDELKALHAERRERVA